MRALFALLLLVAAGCSHNEAASRACRGHRRQMECRTCCAEKGALYHRVAPDGCDCLGGGP